MSLRSTMKGMALGLIERHPRFSMDLVRQGLAGRHGVSLVVVTLAEDCPLGAAGSEVALPLDAMILPQVLAKGAWEGELVKRVADLCRPDWRYQLLDIGANSGLFSLQLMRARPSIARVVAVEPHPHNASILKRNLGSNAKVEILKVALGASAGALEFFEDLTNAGNYSFFPNQIAPENRRVTKVAMEPVRHFLPHHVIPEMPLIWKSDTQGYDTIIVAETPDSIWSQVEIALVEVTPTRETVEYIPAFIAKLAQFDHLTDGQGQPLDMATVEGILHNENAAHIDVIAARR